MIMELRTPGAMMAAPRNEIASGEDDGNLHRAYLGTLSGLQG